MEDDSSKPLKKNMRKENYTTVTASMLVSLAAYT